MAQKKTVKKSGATGGRRPPVQSRTPQTRATQTRANVRAAKKTPDSGGILHQVIPCVLGVFALFSAVCCFFPGSVGVVGAAVRDFFFGTLGGGGYAVPPLCAFLAIRWRNSVEHRALGTRITLAFVVTILLSTLLHAFAPAVLRVYDVRVLWDGGCVLSGGGVLGGLLGTLMLSGFDFAGTMIIVVAALLIFGIFLFGATPRMLWISAAYRIKRRREAREAAYASAPAPSRRVTGREVLPDDPYIPSASESETRPAGIFGIFSGRHRFDPDVPLEEQAPEVESPAPLIDGVRIDSLAEENIVDAGAYDAAKKKREGAVLPEGDDAEPLYTTDDAAHAASGAVDPELDWKSIFINPPIDLPDGAAAAPEVTADIPSATSTETDLAETELEVERRRVSEKPLRSAKKPAEPVQENLYFFPPLDLLHADDPTGAADESELRVNAKRLVDTLASFNVKTRIVNISRGPTITRYELQPEAGTRVRSISNLVDDIALNLATTGVRIEAPIPGKSAVGIEVPNRTAATVYLRGLLESSQFVSAPSKLTAALGKDVAGAPIYLDIAKMPHLLIAGATGMGKSVSINSIIVSLLYKARPDEVKLILIDPKKVELNIYNSLPHLLVPVVSDPKKAAGSLAWAVTEMERRFGLIEEVGARNIKDYNTVTARDNEKEFLPQIVIIIDELADLMMTASDDVEDSICRLAQKARAAGMHLIIGTQRPSVDVITGLIKANIPSRIAFTVASQVDSRTIIDITGAEKLIGRGDMLYAPVGSSKPLRVQGAFVAEEEIERITDFIKSHSGGDHGYSDEVIASIERAAELCGVKKGGSSSAALGEDGEGSDPMLRAALELAVDSGKISTSLIQRKLSLGYGRAAKLIDRMEDLGYVSAPEGQKPREVLITKQQYMEMVLKDADIE